MTHENRENIISSQQEQPAISNEPETTENPPEAIYSKDDAQQLIKKGNIWQVARELKNYQNLDENIAEQLLDKGYCGEVLENLDKFSNLDHSKILKYLIDDGHYEELIDHLDKFPEVNHQQIAQELINQGKIELLAKKLEKFSGLDENIAKKLIKENYYYSVKNHLKAFSNLSLDFAQELIFIRENDNDGQVLDNLESFAPEAHNDIVHFILKNGRHWVLRLLPNWEKLSNVNFSDEDYNTIVNRIAVKYGFEDDIIKNIDKFPRSFHKKIAQLLIDNKKGRAVANNLEKFSGLNHREIAQKLFDNDEGRVVADNLQKFSGLNHREIAQKLLDTNNADALIKNVERFSDIDLNKLIHQMLITVIPQRYYEDTMKALAENLKKLSGLNKDIAIALIHAGGYHARQVANNLQAFPPADHEAIILELIKKYTHDKELANALKNSFGKISQLSETVARALAKSGYIEILAKYPEKFPELDSDLQQQVDNYKATHPNK